MHPRKIAHGSDEHLTLIGAPWHLNMLAALDDAGEQKTGDSLPDEERV